MHMPTKPVEATPLVDGGAGSRRLFACGLAVLGPGFLASLADTDAACLLVAGDSGARYGFSFLILLQMLLVFPLFLAQELTVRLGVHTGQGHGAWCATSPSHASDARCTRCCARAHAAAPHLPIACARVHVPALHRASLRSIRQHFGPIAGWFAFGLLAVSTVPALVSEMSGIAGVASLAGLPPTVGAVLAAVAVLALIYLAPYHYVEMVRRTLGRRRVELPPRIPFRLVSAHLISSHPISPHSISPHPIPSQLVLSDPIPGGPRPRHV
jgi:hypothetical protein